MRDPEVVEACLGTHGGGDARVAELSAGYLGQDVVHQVSFAVDEGEAIAVIGSNGASKTTLFAPCAGCCRASRGPAARQPADHPAPGRHAGRGLAYVPAERHLFPEMTVAENLDLGAFPHRPRAERRVVLELFPRLAEQLGQRRRRRTADGRRRP